MMIFCYIFESPSLYHLFQFQNLPSTKKNRQEVQPTKIFLSKRTPCLKCSTVCFANFCYANKKRKNTKYPLASHQSLPMKSLETKPRKRKLSPTFWKPQPAIENRNRSLFFYRILAIYCTRILRFSLFEMEQRLTHSQNLVSFSSCWGTWISFPPRPSFLSTCVDFIFSELRTK